MSGKKPVAAAFLLVVSVMKASCGQSIEKTPWLPTMVGDSFFYDGKLLQEKSCRTLFDASVECETKNRCQIFCRETPGNFSFWDIIADPFLVAGGGGIAKECWTRHSRGNVILEPGTVLSSSPVYKEDRTTENFKDGASSGQWFDIFHSDGSVHPYILIDLGKVSFVRKVNVYPSSYASTYFKRFANISVRVGQKAMNGDFSQYEEIGIFKGAVAEVGDFLSVDPVQPVLGRFVSIQRYDTSVDTLMVGHVQVYTFSP